MRPPDLRLGLPARPLFLLPAWLAGERQGRGARELGSNSHDSGARGTLEVILSNPLCCHCWVDGETEAQEAKAHSRVRFFFPMSDKPSALQFPESSPRMSLTSSSFPQPARIPVLTWEGRFHSVCILSFIHSRTHSFTHSG